VTFRRRRATASPSLRRASADLATKCPTNRGEGLSGGADIDSRDRAATFVGMRRLISLAFALVARRRGRAKPTMGGDRRTRGTRRTAAPSALDARVLHRNGPRRRRPTGSQTRTTPRGHAREHATRNQNDRSGAGGLRVGAVQGSQTMKSAPLPRWTGRARCGRRGTNDALPRCEPGPCLRDVLGG